MRLLLLPGAHRKRAEIQRDPAADRADRHDGQLHAALVRRIDARAQEDADGERCKDEGKEADPAADILFFQPGEDRGAVQLVFVHALIIA